MAQWYLGMFGQAFQHLTSVVLGKKLDDRGVKTQHQYNLIQGKTPQKQ